MHWKSHIGKVISEKFYRKSGNGESVLEKLHQKNDIRKHLPENVKNRNLTGNLNRDWKTVSSSLKRKQGKD